MLCRQVVFLVFGLAGAGPGCSTQEPSRSNAGPTVSASETAVATAPTASSSGSLATADTPRIQGSGSAPTPTSTARDPRAAALANELNHLDVAMLGTLPDDELLGATRMPGFVTGGPANSASVKLGPGGLASSSALPAATTIHGKAMADARVDDVKAALEQSGCTVTPSADPNARSVLDATCPEHYIVTFFASDIPPPDATSSADMERDSAVLRKDGALLVIHPATVDDLEKAKRLLDKITSSKGPDGRVDVGDAEVTGGRISHAGDVVVGMRAGFRRCYRKGLSSDPTLAGSVRVVASIAADGSVSSAKPSAVDKLPGDVVGCIASRVAAATFAPPEGGSATVTIAVKLSRQ